MLQAPLRRRCVLPRRFATLCCTNLMQTPLGDASSLASDTWEGRVHKGLPRVRSVPAQLFKCHSGSYGSELWRMAKTPSAHEGRSANAFDMSLQEHADEGRDV